MSVSPDCCYECGCDIPDGLSEPARACLGILPGGAQYWDWVDVCPECARRNSARRRARLMLALLLVALLTSVIAYPLLP
jgi:hypothetical protein